MILFLNYNTKPYHVGSFQLTIGSVPFQPTGTGKLSCTYLDEDKAIPVLEEDTNIELPEGLDNIVLGNSALCALQIPLPPDFKITSKITSTHCYSSIITKPLSHTLETSVLCKVVEDKYLVDVKIRISIGWWEEVETVLPSLIDINGCVYNSEQL